MVYGNDQLKANMQNVVFNPSVGLHSVCVANQILCILVLCSPPLRQKSISQPGSLCTTKPTVTTLISAGPHTGQCVRNQKDLGTGKHHLISHIPSTQPEIHKTHPEKPAPMSITRPPVATSNFQAASSSPK